MRLLVLGAFCPGSVRIGNLKENCDCGFMKKSNDSTLNERRSHKRLELVMPISLHSHKGKSGNISNSGVYLEMITDNAENFLKGKMMEFEVTAKTSKIGFENRILGFSTKGVIVRAEKIDSRNNETKLGIALEFNEKLKIRPDKS